MRMVVEGKGGGGVGVGGGGSMCDGGWGLVCPEAHEAAAAWARERERRTKRRG